MVLKITWRHGRGPPFASLRLCENRRLKKEAYFSPRRKGAPFISRDQVSPPPACPPK